MKRILSAILALTMLLSASATVFAAEKRPVDMNRFADWIPGRWYEAAMTWCVQHGYFWGTDVNTIEPDRNITRAECLAVFVRYFRKTELGDISRFTDVRTTSWYYKPIAIGYQAGMTVGISDTAFSPNTDITREQAFTMFIRALKPDAGVPAVLEPYWDVDQISTWAYDAMVSIVYNDIVVGYPDLTLRPRADITRAEVAQILYRCSGENEKDELGNAVRFDPDNGDAVFYQRIRDGYVSEPEAPVKSGYLFGGWYTIDEDGYKYDFDYDTAYAGLELRARWYTPEEWHLVNVMNGSNKIDFSVETDLLATAGNNAVPCEIRYSRNNPASANLELYLVNADGTNGERLFSKVITPGYKTLDIVIERLPAYGNYPVRFVVTPIGGAPIYFEAMLYVAYGWNAGW